MYDGGYLMRRSLLLKSILPVLLTALSVTACGGAGPAAMPGQPVDVRLSLGYIPNVQFAPYYVGIDRGFFAAQGLNVIIEHRQETDGAKLVATGEIPFAVISGEQVLLGRQQGLPLVYVFEWFQHYPVGIASRQELGITTPADLAGHSVGTPVKEGASYIGLEALLASAGLTDADINLQTTGYAQVDTLASGTVDAVVVYVNNEPVQLEAQGIPVNLIRVSDYADLVSNGLVTSEQTLARNPALVRAMVVALAESLQYTIEHPDEAFEISKRFVEGLGDDPDAEAVQREILNRSIELWQADRVGLSDHGFMGADAGRPARYGPAGATFRLGRSIHQ
jgi:NitT/TauT family transport system substrate-binding protein